MSTSNITIRMDSDLKQQAEALFAEMGMNMTTAFTIFTKAVVRERRIPFEIAADSDPFYNKANQERLLRVAERMERSGGRVHELIEVDDD